MVAHLLLCDSGVNGSVAGAVLPMLEVRASARLVLGDSGGNGARLVVVMRSAGLVCRAGVRSASLVVVSRRSVRSARLVVVT
jgi:hypothetical protein